jgi:hypothetical protein
MFSKMPRFASGIVLVGAITVAGIVAAQQRDPVETAPPPEPRAADERTTESPRNDAGVTERGPRLQQPAQTYRAKQIIGSRVSLNEGAEAGTVDDIVFDDYGVSYLIVVDSSNRLVTIPWETAKFSVEKRTAVIHIAPERFEAAPRYTPQQYPAFSRPAYRKEVHGFFGIMPRIGVQVRDGRHD